VLTLPNVVRLKAVMGERMVGFIAGDLRPAQRLGYIATLGVLPEVQGRGIGAALLAACEAQMRVDILRLNVRRSNRSAIHLYEKFGYHHAGIWPDYYQDGEDALIMEKNWA
jgi:ribosomal protein S18 acetylase RimI-like enzyme